MKIRPPRTHRILEEIAIANFLRNHLPPGEYHFDDLTDEIAEYFGLENYHDRRENDGKMGDAVWFAKNMKWVTVLQNGDIRKE